MKNRISIIVLFLFNGFFLFGQEIQVPKNYVLIDTISGDLDNDNIKELVAVFDTKTPDEEFESVARELIIYKIEDGKWVEWKKSKQALYGSLDGGMMGDKYAGIEIKNGIVSISHFGGSSWKWGYTDKYSFQNNEFYLVAYESMSGRICDYWLNVDFNLLTGEMIIKKEYEDCETSEQEIYKTENETFYTDKLCITLEKRHEKEIKIISPKYEHKIYIE